MLRRKAGLRVGVGMTTLAVAMTWMTGAIGAAQANPEPAGKDVTVLSFKLHYLEAGSGPPVVLLHGLGGDGSRWTPNIGPLARDFHVFALDEIGFGQSDKPLANYHTGMLAEFLIGFLKQVGLQKASLVGNSMGAAVALYTAARYPDVVDKIVLADGGGFRRPGEGPRDLTAVEQQAAAHLRQIQNGVTLAETREMFRLMFHDKNLVTDRMVHDQLIMRLRSAFAITKMQESGRTGAGQLTEDEVRNVKAPTLIVWGREDELVDPANADRLANTIPGSRKVLIDDCGHLPQLEKADQFNRLVHDFLKDTTSSQR